MLPQAGYKQPGSGNQGKGSRQQNLEEPEDIIAMNTLPGAIYREAGLDSLRQHVFSCRRLSGDAAIGW
ncbi:MAG: hypothetical protein NTV33_10695 [Coprothermobacterota bacterium]|nr:hypothetical protein [Coprothermobacterota bacterium]